MPLLLVGFPIVAAGLFMFAYAYTHTATAGSSSGSQSGGLGAALTTILTAPLKAILGLANKASRFVVSHWAAAVLRPLVRWFNGWTTRTLLTSAAQLAFGADVVYAIERIVHVIIPRATSRAVARPTHIAKTASLRATKALTRTQTLSTTFTNTHRAQVKLNVHYTHAIDVAIPRRLGRLEGQAKTNTGDIAKLRDFARSTEDGAIDTFKWLRSHPLSAATGVFAGAVAIALQRLGWGVLRCRSWQKLGRSLTCGMGQWLTDLLGLIATFALGTFAVLDPEALAEAAVAAVDVVEPVLQDILSR